MDTHFFFPLAVTFLSYLPLTFHYSPQQQFHENKLGTFQWTPPSPQPGEAFLF